MQDERGDDALTLKGKQVLVTRATSQCGSLCEHIRRYGGEPLPVPLVAYRRVSFSHTERMKWLQAVQHSDWLIFTSQNSLDFFMDLLDQSDRMHGVKIAAVGKKTGERLEAYGLHADFIPKPYTGQALLEAFRNGRLAAEQVAIPHGSLSNRTLLNGFNHLGIKVASRVLYQTIADQASQKQLEEAAVSNRLSAITFASPSAVHFFTELLPEKRWRSALNRCVVAVIGKTTADSLEKLGVVADVVPETFTAASMINALATYYLNKEGSHQNEQQS
ncbi:uroporphyrinogen-III synthase [Sporolactobacillus terrae]|uniref:Uroporphyrinogen-III synthase n=1 Tax=Sporolactobacillus terrae TaxID=269673 RepID=A0ABX5Q5W5_9BACL|nr:uroporphyrinogen-III synthase [Sporolactobacillus terrae]QAA22027.1 uroporphyrinogen-III synthase [Sporolactobacillus terrae]QAA25000.1 uroporphyrinogen-III synthase [Sporolactobacillus terrae]UAK16824.1 uroporphyrinogen-III synthase [Sporolactobacillus terrae]